METKHQEHGLTLDCDFPGGNIIIDDVDSDTVFLHQDLRDTEGFWFYWCFRIYVTGSKTLSFVFTWGDVIGQRGPAFSLDEGETWQWLGRDAVFQHEQGTGFRYRFTGTGTALRFCFAIPYLESHLLSFLEKHHRNPHLCVGTLCHTRKGRAVEVLYLGKPAHNPLYRVLLTSRHHACESMATYVLEGMLSEFLTETPAGLWLQQYTQFMVVPFMDKDGVEDGDQGKMRRPRDHNRDYSGESIYATTRTLRECVPQWSAGKLRVALDLHCPYMKGDSHEVIYFVGGPDMANWSRVVTFSKILEKVQNGALPFRTADNLDFGQGWNTADNMAEGKTFSRWAAALPGIQIGTSLEFPYANVGTHTVTSEAARAFGRDLTRALYAYLSHL